MMKLTNLLFESSIERDDPRNPPSIPRVVTAYHGGPVPIRKFNTKFSAQGVLWFHENKDVILKGESGANSTAYLMTCELTVDKTAGWPEYDKFMLDQLEQWGYDSISLDGNWIIFDPKRVKTLKIEKTTKV